MASEDTDIAKGAFSPTATRTLLGSLGHKPRKPLGQNFLTDGNIVRKSLQLTDVQPGDRVVEIGPGLGTLTGALIDAGAEVYAIEFDANLARHIGDKFGSSVQLVEGDAVDHPIAGLAAVDAEAGYKIVANLPYAITSPWMGKLLSGPLPDTMVLMMQKEAADRLTAQPGTKQYSAIAIFLQSAFEKVAYHKVSRQCFYPVPGVDSVLLSIRKKDSVLLFDKPTRQAIRKLFGQRRKQISTLVKGNQKLESWLSAAANFGVKTNDRPEAIPLEAWQLLAESS